MSPRARSEIPIDGREPMGLDLIGLDCSADGRRHYVDDQHHAEVLAADGDRRFRAICGRLILVASLGVAPGPMCPGCSDLAQDRRDEAGWAASPSPRQRWRRRAGRLHASVG
ncbi:MAG: hypothetical protein L0I76_02160 [Pseudonocardia sp.]|nr:hypothetical protein [Pseudonocardia sp.]